ncbi:hypothetical protein C1X05_00080 [Laceyella sacchari]|uniref:Peptidase S24/S26A/S26B/S26C domain-containing protein n=1 Tax=Laceyella tengchongensis TaxID=574699 RepID=A0AA46AGA3_9BACL|nr:hypothetical protein [Laceyella tengchongensis]AUS07412.1 hypothetical protein C1X05_00080 [Laceyella sacchari]MRG28789.1 hypothetical protein [Laceyella tengchongensis]SMP25557.1 hypothetical protein SAMN06265361_10533 [Laceyella tengchongensis]
MGKREVAIVGKGFTKDFFDVDAFDCDLHKYPMLCVDKSHSAIIAFELADMGLSQMGLKPGDYLLFSDFCTDSVHNKIILVRMEDRYIIRLAKAISPDTSIVGTPGDIYPSMVLPSENIRIIGVMSGFIKPHDNLEILPGGDL